MEVTTYRTAIRFVLSAGILFQCCHSRVNCRNDDGDEVDWYIIYKLPNRIEGGLAYLYMDESTNGWRRSTETINSPSGSLANTLRPLLDFYSRKMEGFGYLLYSDQPPPKYNAPASYGHSKGVVLLDRQTGVWLSHSTPRFPRYQTEDFWPESGNVNGQTFMCVTYSYSEFREIGMQLMYIHPYSYDSDLPTTFQNELRCVAQRSCYPKRGPWFRETMLTSVEGHRFHSFAKYTRLGDDLYSGIIVNSLQQDLYVKSWGRMKRPLPSNCSIPHHVYNVKEVRPRKISPFKDTVDHSKWCVTPDGSWTCIADMNRESSQMGRGGGAICTDNPAIGEAFFAVISSIEQCDSRRTNSNAQHREL